MAPYYRQIRQAQRRLWVNRWIRQWGWTLVFGIAAWTIVWLVNQLLALHLPMGWVALGTLGATLVGSVLWFMLTREHFQTAASAFDEAAGLKERISSGMFCEGKDDPFAQAVQADAERATAGLSASKFIPVRWAGSLSLSGLILAVALLSLLMPEFDLLGKAANRSKLAAEQTKITKLQNAVAKPLVKIQEAMEKSADAETLKRLKELRETIERPENTDADLLRRETVKQLDSLRDQLKEKMGSDKFRAFEEAKKRLSKIGDVGESKDEVAKLMEAMSDGDFKEAQKSVEKMKESLAKRAEKGDVKAEDLKQMKDKLNDLSKKLQEAAKDQQSEKQLQNSGMSKEEAKKLLQQLSKMSKQELQQKAKELAEKLQKQGVTKKQMQQMLQKMQERQKACKQCEKMGQAMKGASKQMEQGQMGEASKELGKAGKMLNDMEMMEQSLNDLETQLSQLDQAREDMNEDEELEDPYADQVCKQCDGSGLQPGGQPCPGCNGDGKGGGGPGRGRGNRDRDDSVKTSTVDKKAKVKTTEGTIIGQQFVKGGQLKGDSQAAFYDAAAAAELEATDALNRNRVPAHYREGVKHYFDRLPQRLTDTDKPPAPQDQNPAEADEEASKTTPADSDAP